MGDEERGASSENRRGDPVEGGFSILLGEDNMRAFMSSGDFSSARELERFIELGAKIEGRFTGEGSRSILAMSMGENRLSRDFSVLQIAHILAKHGKDVLIVDCDFLSPGLSGLVENTEDQGFLDLLLYGSSLKTVARPTGIDGVIVVGPGSFPVSRTIPFAMKEFIKVRDFLSRSHDIVIYCSTLYTDDGTVNPFASLVDSIFLSCRLEEMPEGQLQKNLGDLGPNLPPADLVCFGADMESLSEEDILLPAVLEEEGEEKADEGMEGEGEDGQLEAAAIEKTGELEGEGRRKGGGMSLPRLVTAVVVTVVVVFLVWWFMIHRSISDKEGESKTAELVQKQMDVKEMKDRSQDEASTAAGEEVSAETSGDRKTGGTTEEPPERIAAEKVDTDRDAGEGEIGDAAKETAVDEAAEIPEKPISKPGTVTPAPAGSHFAVHVASFKEIERAGRETDYLEKKGHAATVISAEVNGQTWYRVYVGEYRTREEAAAMRLQLLDLPQVGYARVVTLKDMEQ
jgi:cell division septation protein DedD